MLLCFPHDLAILRVIAFLSKRQRFHNRVIVGDKIPNVNY